MTIKLNRVKWSRLIAWACLLFSPIAIHANLVFEKTVIEDTVSPSQDKYPFVFTFKNTGDYPVTITNVKTSCGCTTAALSKEVYQPGESGEIEGSLHLDKGKQDVESMIIILANDIIQEEIRLVLRLRTPILVVADPKLLMWARGDMPVTKKIKILSNDSTRDIQAQDILVSNEVFSITDRRKDKNGAILLCITPTDTNQVAHAVISIDLDLGDGIFEKCNVYTVIKN